MRLTFRNLAALLFAVLTFTNSSFQALAADASAGTKADRALAQKRMALRESAAKASFSFVPNRGQAGKDDLFVARGGNVAIALKRRGLEIDTATVVTAGAKDRTAQAADGGMFGGADASPAVAMSRVRLEFAGANDTARVEGLDQTAARVNFLHGKDPAGWQTNLPMYSRVRYGGLYEGIDLVYYGERERHLEYDLVVAPGADPEQIRLKIASDHGAAIDKDGNLRLDGDGDGSGGGVSLMRPVIYQNLADGKRMVTGGFVKRQDGTFGFAHGEYDHTKPLIIDPTINMVYATYAGGIHNDEAFDMTLDAVGNAYIAGESASQDFPVTANALQQTRQNIGSYVYDAVVMKFDPSGNLLFSTFLGGAQNEQGEAIQVDANGLIYLGGSTGSTDFPVTSNAYQETSGGNTDAFFSVISNDGSQLIYSTYLGGSGSENISRMVMDSTGAFFMTGAATAVGLPASAGAYQSAPKGSDNGFVAKVTYTPANAQPFAIAALTFLGGSSTNGEEIGLVDIALDATGNVYVTGASNSNDYPTTANAYQQSSLFTLATGCYNTPSPNTIGVVSELSGDLKTLIYSTALGGKTEDQNGYPVCNQYGRTIHPDGKGNIWVVGTTGMIDFPTTGNAISKQLNGNGDAGVDLFVSELTPGAQTTALTYSSYLGGSQFDYGSRAVWDTSGDIWVIGTTASTDWPGIVQGTSLQATSGGGYDIGLLELQPDATKILYSTYLGGSGDEDAQSGRAAIAIDAGGSLHLAGGTGSANFPVTASAIQPTFANGDSGPDGYDIYYAVLGSGTIGTVGPAVAGNTGDTTITVNGAGFAAGASCQLVSGSTTITAGIATVNAGGTSVSCSFALSGAVAGSYDIVIANPNGGSTLTKAAAVTIQSGGGPNISAQIVGRAAVRIGTPTTFYITVTNSGTQDAFAVPLWVTLPSNIPFTINNYSASASASLATTVGSNNYVLLLVPGVAAGQTLTIPLQITAPVGIASASIPITASVQAPWFGSVSDLTAAGTSDSYTPTCVAGANPLYQNCLGAYISIFSAGQVATSDMVLGTHALVARPNDGGGLIDFCKKASGFTQGYMEGMADAKTDLMNGNSDAFHLPEISLTNEFEEVGYFYGYVVGIGSALGGGAGAGHVIAGPIAHMSPGVVSQLLRSASLGNAEVTLPSLASALAYPRDGESCPAVPPPAPPPSMQPVSPIKPMPVGAIDPNDKGGSTGDGSASHYINAGSPLPYNVAFENEPTATAPAAQVIVTDQLDPTKVDLTTVTLGTITFGTNVITLPNGTNNYNTTYKLSASLSVRIQGSLDTTTGLLKWTFTSIDPSTGLPPTDPTVGFLPPDTDGVVGQGSVNFRAMPKAGQATGATVSNTAVVYFDANPSINTPTWVNTLDVDAPVSKVTALPATEAGAGATTPVNVSWSGTDKGSGILYYDIYVSDTGGAFTQWLSQVSTTSAVYSGVTNHTYAFYSIATDAAGNIEAAKTVGDATTQIVGATTTAALTASATSITLGQSVTLTAAVTGAGGTPTGMVTFLSGTTVLGMGTLNGSGVATLSTTGLLAGANAVTAQYGGDSNFATATSNTVTVTVGLVPTATALKSSAATAVQGAPVTFTATVTPQTGMGVPTGSVAFMNGTTVLGMGNLTAGVATFSTTALAVGGYSVTAVYGGDAMFAASTSAVVAEVISTPTFALTSSASTLTITKGTTGTATLTVTPTGTIAQAVSFTCAGLPADATCNFSPASVTPGASAATTTVTIATNVATAELRMPGFGPASSRGGFSGVSLAGLLMLGVGCAAGASRRQRTLLRRANKLLLLMPVLLGLAGLALVGCGGGSSSGTPTAPVTPSGTSMVVITASGGGQTATATITVTVP